MYKEWGKTTVRDCLWLSQILAQWNTLYFSLKKVLTLKKKRLRSSHAVTSTYQSLSTQLGQGMRRYVMGSPQVANTLIQGKQTWKYECTWKALLCTRSTSHQEQLLEVGLSDQRTTSSFLWLPRCISSSSSCHPNPLHFPAFQSLTSVQWRWSRNPISVFKLAMGF